MDNDLMLITFLISCFITIYRKQGIFYCQDMFRVFRKNLEGNNKHRSKEGNDGTI